MEDNLALDELKILFEWGRMLALPAGDPEIMSPGSFAIISEVVTKGVYTITKCIECEITESKSVTLKHIRNHDDKRNETINMSLE